MILTSIYIQRYKNYTNQHIAIDKTYSVSLKDGYLAIKYHGEFQPEILKAERKIDNLHLFVGKTGSGKTNLLQLIGMKQETRTHRMWDGEDDAYFLLYRVNETEFYMEICNMEIKQFSEPKRSVDKSMPGQLRKQAQRMDRVQTVYFSIDKSLQKGEEAIKFQQKDKEQWKNIGNETLILNCYDIHSFLKPPYEDSRENTIDTGYCWISRSISPYHRTSLWYLCDYIHDYMEHVEAGILKKNVSLVLSTHNFAEKYPLKLSPEIAAEYWTYWGRKRAEGLEYYKKKKPVNKSKKSVSNKQMFIHDLWADYGHYLRKWVAKIQNYNAMEAKGEKKSQKSLQEDRIHNTLFKAMWGYDPQPDINKKKLPDGRKMSIVDRCMCLAEYIDYADSGRNPGLVWQILDDVKDITKFLSKLDDKYFTMENCTILVKDIYLPKYKLLFHDMFERMEQYIPDNAGIFTECLLPYEFTHMSTGEYQYAKVLGGIEEGLKIFTKDTKDLDKIILLDEPDAYMHPELARQFISRLQGIVEKYQGNHTTQVIIGTHSPFIVTDVLPQEITRLNINEETGEAMVMELSEKAYFGANLFTVFADSFFLDYTIGEYSRSFLQKQFTKLQKLAEQAEELSEEEWKYVVSIKDFLPHIGDALIQRAFESVLNVWSDKL